jgi:sterol-4alpha-carboxylate 3-dehydrogenase (decarboxylating)
MIHTENSGMENNYNNYGTVLLTGGAGFLGTAIIKELLEHDAPVQFDEVRVFDLKEPSVSHDKINFIKRNIKDYDAVNDACKDVDVVIHAAAIVDWGTHSEEEVLAVNTGGTANIVKACQENGVKAMVYTSSLDAVYSGKPLVDVDETLPYPEKHETMYCRSKYLGEVEVIKAAENGLNACVLRPSDIYGENDPFHMGSLINMAKGGFYIRLGDGKSKNQHVYVHNMAFAHLQAAEALMNGNSKVTGNVYFITDGPATNFFNFFDQIVEKAGYRIWPKNLWLPRGLAFGMASLSEGIAWLIRPFKKYHPKFSRFAVTYTCTDYTFSAKKAENDFGFKPKYSEGEAVQRTIDFYRDQRKQG